MLNASRPGVFTLLAGLPLLVLASCSSTRSAFDAGDQYYRNAKYDLALEAYEQAKRDGASGTEVDRRLRNARLALELQQATRAFYSAQTIEDLEAARLRFMAIEEQLPTDPNLTMWTRKASLELAGALADAAEEAMTERDFDHAESLLRRGEEVFPTHERTVTLLAEVNAQQAELRRQGARYYDIGTGAHNGRRPLEAIYGFRTALGFDEHLDRAQRRLEQVEEEYSYDLKEKVDDLVERGKWGAALQALDEVEALNPELAGIADLRTDLKHEVEAQELLEKAQSARARREFDEARRHLAAGELLTTRQKHAFKTELATVRSYEFVGKYTQARKYANEGRYELALTLYREIVDVVENDPDLYKEALVVPREEEYVLQEDYDPQIYIRKPKNWWTYHRARTAWQTLLDRLQIARRFYEDAQLLETNGKLEEAMQLYSDIMIDLPNYQDVYERRAALAEKLEQAKAGKVVEPTTGAGEAGEGSVSENEGGTGSDG
ncbi:MAG: hypothetical protein H6834_09695 [Planctomycetes bacterium]|nr:hypothetical protein [Planctomycetota bacterium]